MSVKKAAEKLEKILYDIQCLIVDIEEAWRKGKISKVDELLHDLRSLEVHLYQPRPSEAIEEAIYDEYVDRRD